MLVPLLLAPWLLAQIARLVRALIPARVARDGLDPRLLARVPARAGARRRTRRCGGALLLLAACVISVGILATSSPALAEDSRDARVTVETLSGEPVRGKALLSIDDEAVVLGTANGTSTKVPRADVIGVSFGVEPDPPHALSAAEVALDLWSGEELRGDLIGGASDRVKVRSPLLGVVEVRLDAIGGVRFLERLARVAEPPDLTSNDTNDIVHLVGGDRLVCTVASFGAEALLVDTSARDGAPFPYDRVTAIRLVREADAAEIAGALELVLRDGTRVTGTGPQIADGRLRLKSVSGFEVEVALDDVVAAQVRSDSFAYLSDLPTARIDVVPFWDLVAGDAVVLYAPRTDRAFGGEPLRCNGRTWLKGMGVYSGTTLTYDLGGKYRELRTEVGVDDSAGPLGGVIFEVLVDGELKWSSRYVRAARGEGHGQPGPLRAPRIALKDAKTLALRVLAGDEEAPYPIQDQADWLGTILLK